MEKNHTQIFYVVLAVIGVVSLILAVTGKLDITGFATTQPTLTTVINYPADGASFKKGETFTVSATVKCVSGNCQESKATIQFPSGGFQIASGAPTIALGRLSSGNSKSVSWLVLAASNGNHPLSILPSGKNTIGYNSQINVNVYIPACNSDNDCGTSGYITGNYCGSLTTVLRDYKASSCNNPGTVNAFCSSSITQVLQQTCAAGCQNGQCRPVQNSTS